MHFSFLDLLPVVGLALAQTQFNCATKFFPTLDPGEQFTVDDLCQFFPGYPRVIDNIKVSVAYTQEWGSFAGSTDLIEQVTPVLDDSLTKSITYYNTFASLPAAIVVILTTESLAAFSAETIFPIDMKPPCQIQTFQRWTENAATNVPWALQQLAHELYHCVQINTLGNSPSTSEPSSLWVIEGSANYFSNLVYPRSNIEWPQPNRNYDPVLPIYAQVGGNVYGAGMYFQALEQPRGPLYIHDWVMSTDQTDNGADERERLSTLPKFTDDFYIFAKQFSLKSIQDTSGVLIPGLADVTPKAVSLTLDSSGSSATASLQVLPFTISTFEFEVDSGQTLQIYSSAKANQRVAYRQPSESAWTEMPNVPQTGSQGGFIELPCDNQGSTVTVLVLFVSTADADSDTVQISLQQESADSSCLCKQSTSIQRRGLQDCKNSTSTCLYGSWKLTAADYEDGIKSVSYGTISNLDADGSATFTLDQDTKVATLQFNSLTASWDETDDTTSSEGEDTTVHYDLAIDGGGTATAVLADDGKSFHFANPTYTGKFASQTTFPEATPQGPDGDFSLGFGPDVNVLFGCDESSSRMGWSGQSGVTIIYHLSFEPADTTA
jgi:hypothetical protein